jgi:ribose 5-phosphate isomerase A
VDCVFPAIENPAALEAEIRNIPGALECGLFVSLAQAAFIAGADGTSVMEPGI